MVEAPAPNVPAPRRQVDSRKKKLAHLKTLLEFEEKKEITGMLRDIADVVGHNIQFSIFNRGLLLAALSQKPTSFGLRRRSPGSIAHQTGTLKRSGNTRHRLRR